MRKASHIKKVKVVNELNANIGKLYTALDINSDLFKDALQVGYLTAIGDFKLFNDNNKSSKYYHEFLNSESATVVSLNSFGSPKHDSDLLYNTSNLGSIGVGSKYYDDLLSAQSGVVTLKDNQIYSKHYIDSLSDNVGFGSLGNDNVYVGKDSLDLHSKLCLTNDNCIYIDSQSSINSVYGRSDLFPLDSVRDYISCNFEIQDFLKNDSSNIFESLELIELFEAKKRDISFEEVINKIVNTIFKTIKRIKSLVKQLAYLLKNFRVIYIRNIIRKHLKNLNNSSSDEDGMNLFVLNSIKYFIHKIRFTNEQRNCRISY